MLKAFIYFLVLFQFLTVFADTPPNVKASNTDSRQLYLEGVRLYQEKNYEDSLQIFQEALKDDEYNKYILYNLSLSAGKSKKIGLTLGGLRRALYVDPFFTEAKKYLAFISEKGLLNTPADESFQAILLSFFSFNLILIFSLLLFIVSGYSLIKYFGLRRQALIKESNLPSFPYVGFFSFDLFIIFLIIFSLKTLDYFNPKAIIITQNVDVRSGPANEHTSLIKASEGQELTIKKVNNDWVQVDYSDGIIGWVPKESLFFTSGRKPW